MKEFNVIEKGKKVHLVATANVEVLGFFNLSTLQLIDSLYVFYLGREVKLEKSAITLKYAMVAERI